MKRVLSIVCAALAVATLAGSVAADNGHLYNGSYCKTYYASTTADLDHLYNGIYNHSNSPRWINCPVLVDEGAHTTGTTLIKVNWKAHDKDDTLVCTFYSLHGDGSILQTKTKAITGSGDLEIPDITKDDSRGSYDVVCSLPPFGRLNRILVVEK